MPGGAREFRFAAEDEVLAILSSGSMPTPGTLLCLRRKLPDWWQGLLLAKPGLALTHVSIEPSLAAGCEESLYRLLADILAGLEKPVLVFCKEGRHRSGMVEALVLIRQGVATEDAITQYVARARGGARDREIALIRHIATRL